MRSLKLVNRTYLRLSFAVPNVYLPEVMLFEFEEREFLAVF